MDAKGARELARRLEELHGSGQPALRPEPLEDATAAPVFHYLGIEPPVAENAPEEPQPGRGRRRRRPRG
jgi:hypothetical protein